MSDSFPRACLLLLVVLGCGSKTSLEVEPLDAGAPTTIMDAGGQDAGSTPPDAALPDAGPPACVPGVVDLETSTVEVVFVIDRSGSMDAAFDGGVARPGESRWEILESALSDALMVFDDRVALGAKFFPTRSRRPVEDSCAVFDGLDVNIGPGRAPGVIAQFGMWNPAGGTPMGAATREALEALTPRSSPTAAQFIVLATDGAPSCGPSPVDEALEVIRESREDHGIDVYVLGIASSEPETALLDIMAIEGGRPRPDTEARRFYDASDPTLLSSLLREITTDLAQCVFLVPIPPDEDDEVEVSIGGAPIARDESRVEGWDWTNERREQLSLFGTACDQAIDNIGGVRANIRCN